MQKILLCLIVLAGFAPAAALAQQNSGTGGPTGGPVSHHFTLQSVSSSFLGRQLNHAAPTTPRQEPKPKSERAAKK